MNATSSGTAAQRFSARAWGLTDVGRKRLHNEDSYLINLELATFIVADGMGGHAHGELASRMAVEIIEEEIFRQRRRKPSPFDESGPDAVTRVVSASVQLACARIFDLAQRINEYAGMGTTATTVVFHDSRAIIGHVGDSRAYLLRDGAIRQVTDDHSWVNEQVKGGLLTADEARSSRYKNVITRSVGFERDVEVDTEALLVRDGDLLLMCSDGLSNLVTDDEIAETLRSSYYQKAPAELIDLANARGGDDNISVVLVEAVGAERSGTA
ncbi:MAG: Stp1/IreP family PP2C-type Ser/Thr phosphatase [Deltaproteobacteria bacterium]|nr:Stp1/IreP family PP2C-type Ser/Thr phosphatase [Deltaproteobacteria bacterium]